MQTLVSFSQECEDIILYHLLEKVSEPIFYVDVGANDPVFISVTKFFYERGASGINIEPQHDFIEKLNADRPRDLNLEIGVGNENGRLKLYGNGAGASFDVDLDNASTCREVAIITLAEVFKKYVPHKQPVHFLKIDVENFERQVLEGMDFDSYRPWIVCMESTLPGTSIPSWDNWEQILLSQNYDFLGMSGVNRYYVATEAKYLINDFCDFEKLKDIYNIIILYKVMQKAEDYDRNEVVYKSKITNILKHLYGTK
ncbi:FkbM family methyltransferase [Selenomonas sp. AE3005]|uniref:FkbM family methyltransferase n=1 Tax=Selenomonas sp. AE3005 TaxID=1485543 RepID=UPI0025FE9D33|nr:FkbM family methyltransferase [Selenomonas sp. AE3005]